ncbi:MAG: hypothetical protein SOX31_08830 [Eubacteriales bacterium]|nr:hypothetical protein [Eubacteriales bacterium]
MKNLIKIHEYAGGFFSNMSFARHFPTPQSASGAVSAKGFPAGSAYSASAWLSGCSKTLAEENRIKDPVFRHFHMNRKGSSPLPVFTVYTF